MLAVFGTDMHLVTFLFVVIESIMFFIQLVYFLFRPQNKDRLRFLVLLALLIFYNLTGGLFPDPKLPISIVLQNILAFGGGFIMASYIPYYFYKAFDLRNLRFQALYGIFLFLLLPFVVFFCFFYALNGDIDFAVKWGIVIPLVYAFYMLGSIFIELKRKYQKGEISNLLEAAAAYCAIIPWASLPIMAYLHASQLMEVSFNNGGFLIISILYLNQIIKQSRSEYLKLEELGNSLCRQVTERTQQIKELSEQQANNFINLVHETKTPLTLINNYFQEYVEKKGTDQDLEIIKGGISKLTNDIENLFDVERLEKGLCVYNHENYIDFSAFLKQFVLLFTNYCNQNRINLQSDIEESLIIKADEGALDRIINNVVGNAVKFTPQGGLIKVSLVKKADQIIFIVQDSGQGIPKELHLKIFEPYYQINHEKSSSLVGLGLGLPIVKNVVESLKGTISIESDPNAIGTTFKIYFPIEKEVPNLVDPKPVKSISFPKAHSFPIQDSFKDAAYPTIFLIEDNPAMLSFLVSKLKTKDINIYSAKDGNEALNKLNTLSINPDLILSDIMMDGMDGFSLANALSTNLKFQHIPIIFLSARSNKEDRLKGFKLGAIDFISKPFSFDELEQKIDAVLQFGKNQKKAVLSDTIQKLMSMDSESHVERSRNTNPVEQSRNIERSQNTFEDRCIRFDLTSREIDIVHQLKKGKTNKEIAEILNIAERTVTTHVRNVMEKVQAVNRLEVINIMFEN